MGEIARMRKQFQAINATARVLWHSRRGAVGVTGRPRPVPLVVSLTSYPPRFAALRVTLHSLLQQRLKPDRIMLWLSPGETGSDVPPPWLASLRRRGVTTCMTDEANGSYGKLLPALAAFPQAVIVTADDDVVYPPDWLEGLYRTHMRHARDVVFYRGYRITRASCGALAPYRHWPLDNERIHGPELFPTGVSGVLYPPGSLHPVVADRALAERLTPAADDVWFKAAALLNGTTSRKVGLRSRKFPEVPRSQSVALFRQNRRDDGNDRKIRAVFDHFRLNERLCRGDERLAGNMSMANAAADRVLEPN